MKVTAARRALDKLYKRRDRYEIPEWQRGKVWSTAKKQQLIDSVLRGWRLPKFYFVRNDDEEYEVVDGQQRLTAIFDFFANQLPLAADSVGAFGGPYYKDLKQKFSDAFDDFEIDYDEIVDASEPELKEFFQRLQQGLPLTASEKLNAVHSALRDYCRQIASHPFFVKSISVPNTRFAHFDIVTKVAAIEIEGIKCSLRYEDVRALFESQAKFSSTSAVAKRIQSALDFLALAFPDRNAALKNRTIVQSIVTFVCKLVATGHAAGLEAVVRNFTEDFVSELSHQIELGQGATDYDFIRFQRSINANVKAGPAIRQEILLRKAFMFDPNLADAFDPSVITESGISGRVRELADSIANRVHAHNNGYSALHGEDLFKATNRTANALISIGKPVKDIATYKEFVANLYFLFRESVGARLGDNAPDVFKDVNLLRTAAQHDVDHGDPGKIRAKKKKLGSAFAKYSGTASPELLDPARFVLVQANLLSAIDLALTNLVIPPVSASAN